MSNGPTTQREALAAQMFEDIDALVRRLEDVSGDMRANCEQAISDAAGKALLRTQMNFESVMAKQQNDLLQAGRAAAAKLGNELHKEGNALVLAAGALRRRIIALAVISTLAALGAGLVGGFVGARLAMGM
ncbi:hypothetical protein [Pseudomonas gingeri]